MCQFKRRPFLSLSATIVGGGLVAGKTAHSLQNAGRGALTGVYHHVHIACEYLGAPLLRGTRRPTPRKEAEQISADENALRILQSPIVRATDQLAACSMWVCSCTLADH